jgi:hypothetical protein
VKDGIRGLEVSAADMLSGLHPAIALALRPHLAIAAAAPLLLFRARCGRHPAFRSVGDAEAYERGYRAWPARAALCDYGTPMAQGWLDRECEHVSLESRDQIARDEAKRDAYDEAQA